MALAPLRCQRQHRNDNGDQEGSASRRSARCLQSVRPLQAPLAFRRDIHSHHAITSRIRLRLLRQLLRRR